MKILHSNIIGDSNKHLIILHGFLGMGDNWKTHAKKIAAEGFTVHLLDLRNHGRSFWDQDFSFDSMAEDISNYLKFKNISKVDMLGHSMGGNLAIYISNKTPNIINNAGNFLNKLSKVWKSVKIIIHIIQIEMKNYYTDIEKKVVNDSIYKID